MGGDDFVLGGMGDDLLVEGPGFDKTFGLADEDTCEGEIEKMCELDP